MTSRQRWGRRAAAAAGLLLVAVVVAAGWMVWQGLQARDLLVASAPAVQQLQDQVAGGDVEAARRTLATVQGDSGEARRLTSGPLWSAAARLPVLGDDVRAATGAARVVDDVAQQGLPPVLDAGAAVLAAGPGIQDGRVPLAPIRSAGTLLREGARQLEASSAAADGIETAGVDERITAPVRALRLRLAEVAAGAGSAAGAVELMPGMLGGDGPRSYLVMFQNNAEARATGGMPGAFAVLAADDGRIELRTQRATSGTFPRFPEPVLDLPAETRSLHTDRLGTWFSDTNLTPHFPTTGEMAREMWRRTSGEEVDAVLSVDPVALSYLLEATGPVTLPNGAEVRADGAVDLLLSQVYASYPEPLEQDAFFGQAATAIFDALVDGRADPAALRGPVARAVGERRLLLWSARPDEQRLIAGSRVGGALPASDGERPFVGVFLNDGTAAKMHYYLREQVRVVTQGCADADGYRHLGVEVTLTSTAPPDAATSLPVSVTGDGVPGSPPGVMRTQVLVYGSTAGGVGTVRSGDELVAFLSKTEQGRPVAVFFSDLLPGQSRTYTVDLLVPASEDGEVQVRTTPGVVPDAVAIEPHDCS